MGGWVSESVSEGVRESVNESVSGHGSVPGICVCLVVCVFRVLWFVSFLCKIQDVCVIWAYPVSVILV